MTFNVPAITVTKYDYHQKVVEERFVPLARALALAFDPPVRRVEPYLDFNLDPPVCMIFPSGEVSAQKRGNTDEIQAFGEVMRLALGPVTQGYDGKLARSLRLWTPTVMNYLRKYRMLKFPSSDPVTGAGLQDTFDHLEFAGANEIDPSLGIRGIDLNLVFYYSVQIKPAPGNS